MSDAKVDGAGFVREVPPLYFLRPKHDALKPRIYAGVERGAEYENASPVV